MFFGNFWKVYKKIIFVYFLPDGGGESRAWLLRQRSARVAATAAERRRRAFLYGHLYLRNVVFFQETPLRHAELTLSMISYRHIRKKRKTPTKNVPDSTIKSIVYRLLSFQSVCWRASGSGCVYRKTSRPGGGDFQLGDAVSKAAAACRPGWRCRGRCEDTLLQTNNGNASWTWGGPRQHNSAVHS